MAWTIILALLKVLLPALIERFLDALEKMPASEKEALRGKLGRGLLRMRRAEVRKLVEETVLKYGR